MAEHHKESERRADRRSGLLAELIANFASGKDDVPITWLDFFPEHAPEGYLGHKRRTELKKEATAVIAAEIAKRQKAG